MPRMNVPKGGQSLKNNSTWSCPEASLTLVLTVMSESWSAPECSSTLPGGGGERDTMEENATAIVDSQGFMERNQIVQTLAFL